MNTALAPLDRVLIELPSIIRDNPLSVRIGHAQPSIVPRLQYEYLLEYYF